MRDELDSLVERTARVSDADAAALPLRAAEADLMEEIMSTSVLESMPGTEPPRRRRGARRLVVLAGAAAAVAAGVLVVQPGGDDQPAWAAELLEVAESAPRLIVDGPDWGVVRAYEFSVDEGEVTFGDGTDELELSWIGGDRYESLLADRRDSIDHEDAVTVAGHEAVLIQYSGAGPVFTTIWQQNGYAMEAVGRTFDDQESYEAVLALLTETDVDTWLAAMPDTVIKPDEQTSVVAEMLEGVPTPAGFDPATLGLDGVADRYHVGATVAGEVACAWIRQWGTAIEAGDTAAADEAVAAMATSREWPVLLEIASEGDYAETVWLYADMLAAGGVDSSGKDGDQLITDEVPVDDAGTTMPLYQMGLGCS
ncbi:hypothetical protein E1212_03290 [Jiangella ureilytica]|uniref:Uncharacterized protein n=1 Tax=Jiangella ureilytica TaxID=2530374 RepID=A0A4R4RYW5_9ACTN|nr:hypothetical protein [Jiangella ureilytica]TDC54172.1 hypothetical protein E1212_03290 [Jiangella ureilytica]